MKCDLCGKNESQYHFFTIKNNELVEVHLCKECEEKRKYNGSLYSVDDHTPQLLEGLLQSRNREKMSLPELCCSICGTSSRDVIRNKILGCANCYNIFSHLISKKMKGRGALFIKNDTGCTQSSYINALKKELTEAVKLEKFEKAAKLRDKIRDSERDGFLHDY